MKEGPQKSAEAPAVSRPFRRKNHLGTAPGTSHPQSEGHKRMKTIHRFRFEPEVPLEQAETTLVLAIIAAEALHGQAAVRLSMRYLFGEEKRACVIDGDSEAARHVILIFTQFLIHEFGENAFQVTWEQHEAKPSKATREEPTSGTGCGACAACGKGVVA
jgi:hypothetical protein